MLMRNKWMDGSKQEPQLSLW